VAIEADDEILQDFLVEAGEILEQLNEQLVELEQNPTDLDLLNAVFRGFHTIKGGAGFLSLDPMVAICHRSEDMFNVLRQGDQVLNSYMMDHFLEVLDILNAQFDQITAGEEPSAASDELLLILENMVKGETEETPVEAVTEEPVAEAAATEEPQGDITDDEFEALLDAMQGSGEASAAGSENKPAETKATESEEISDEEFDNLLDELNGSGKPPTAPVAGKENAATASTSSDEEISDDEFDALLDELHGSGKPPVTSDESKSEANQAVEKTSAEQKPVTPPKAAVPAPAKKPESKEKEVAKKPDAKAPARPTAEATVRVDTRRLDDIMNMVGELVLVRNRLSTLKDAMNDEQVTTAVANLDIVTSDLQSAVMKTRMQPIKKVFGRFPRVVRDLARSLKKEVNLELVGEDTDLDKNLVEALADPLVHLVRNSVDHGIEMPDQRVRNGKPSAGHVLLSAAQEGDHILLIIEDDGAGMDPDVLRQKAVEKGLMDKEEASRLEDRECFELIFHPGFSTKDVISDVSGRGVGMDVVKTRIGQLNGSIEIDSKLGKGTILSIKLPLTLAILPTLMVKIGRRNFALPLSSVNEIFHMESYKTNVVDGQLTVMVRDKAMPLFHLTKWLVTNMDEPLPDEEVEEQVVVTHLGSQRIGFVVSQVVGQEEVVIKPLGHLLHGLAGFAGATITGDGRIALILDVPGLMRAHIQ